MKKKKGFRGSLIKQNEKLALIESKKKREKGQPRKESTRRTHQSRIQTHNDESLV